MKINSLLILSPFLLVCCKMNIAGNAAAISNQADTLGVKTLTIKYEVKVGLYDFTNKATVV